jgi:hypothetical protein
MPAEFRLRRSTMYVSLELLRELAAIEATAIEPATR